MARSTLYVPREILALHLVTVVNATDSNSLAVQVDERLTKATADRLDGIVRYAWKQHMRADDLGPAVQQGHSTLVYFDADVSSTVRDELADGWFDFLDSLPRYVRQGTPRRITDRRGPGTKGTRLVEGIGGNVEVAVYADEVLRDGFTVEVQS